MFIGQAARYLDLITFISEKSSSYREIDPKNAVKRRATDRSEAANKCLYRPKNWLRWTVCSPLWQCNIEKNTMMTHVQLFDQYIIFSA